MDRLISRSRSCTQAIQIVNDPRVGSNDLDRSSRAKALILATLVKIKEKMTEIVYDDLSMCRDEVLVKR